MFRSQEAPCGINAVEYPQSFDEGAMNAVKPFPLSFVEHGTRPTPKGAGAESESSSEGFDRHTDLLRNLGGHDRTKPFGQGVELVRGRLRLNVIKCA